MLHLFPPALQLHTIMHLAVHMHAWVTSAGLFSATPVKLKLSSLNKLSRVAGAIEKKAISASIEVEVEVEAELSKK